MVLKEKSLKKSVLGENLQADKENREMLLKIRKKINLEVYSENATYVITPRQQNAVQNQNIMTVNFALKVWISSNI